MALRRFSDNPAATTPLSGTEVIPGLQGGADVQMTAQDIADLAPSASTTVSIITEASPFTADPATHAGTARYIRAGGDVTFNSTESYAAGEAYNIRATASITLVGTGVTLTPPSGGTLDLDAAMTVTVIMTSSTAGDVMGQTVPA